MERASRSTRRPTKPGLSGTEPGIAENPGHAAAPREKGVIRSRGVESPEVEVLDAVLAVYEVQRRALAEGHADEPFPKHAVPRFSREEVLPVQARDLGQVGKIFDVDRIVGAARTLHPTRPSGNRRLAVAGEHLIPTTFGVRQQTVTAAPPRRQHPPFDGS